MNDEEILLINKEYLKINRDNIENIMKELAKAHNIDYVCITIRKHGSILLHKNKIYKQKAFKVEVKDTVGAGDYFLATLITNLLNDITPEDALKKASAMGALIASKRGANPEYEKEELLRIYNSGDYII